MVQQLEMLCNTNPAVQLVLETLTIDRSTLTFVQKIQIGKQLVNIEALVCYVMVRRHT